MNTFFWWIFDALVIIICATVIYSNAKRGVTKVLLLGVGYFIAALSASLVSMAMAPVLYNSVSQETTVSAIEHANRHFDLTASITGAVNAADLGITCDKGTIRSILEKEKNETDQVPAEIYRYIRSKYDGKELITMEQVRTLLKDAVIRDYGKQLDDYLPAYVRTNFERKMEQDQRMTGELVQMLSKQPTAAETLTYVEENFAKEPTLEVLQIFSYLILFSIVMVLAAVIAAMMENSIFFNNTRFRERVLGGLVGIIETTVMLMLLTLVVRLLVMLGGGKLLCFNEPTIEESIIFRHFYHHLEIIL